MSPQQARVLLAVLMLITITLGVAAVIWPDSLVGRALPGLSL